MRDSHNNHAAPHCSHYNLCDDDSLWDLCLLWEEKNGEGKGGDERLKEGKQTTQSSTKRFKAPIYTVSLACTSCFKSSYLNDDILYIVGHVLALQHTRLFRKQFVWRLAWQLKLLAACCWKQRWWVRWKSTEIEKLRAKQTGWKTPKCSKGKRTLHI